MALATLASFVEGIRQSQVLSAEQCDEVDRLQQDVETPRELAQILLRREWLTAYQINQIFQGNGSAASRSGRTSCWNGSARGGWGRFSRPGRNCSIASSP